MSGNKRPQQQLQDENKVSSCPSMLQVQQSFCEPAKLAVDPQSREAVEIGERRIRG